jgi:hypothetical protein
MTHELKKEWVKPELKVISSAKMNETVLVWSVKQTQQADPYSSSDPTKQ